MIQTPHLGPGALPDSPYQGSQNAHCSSCPMRCNLTAPYRENLIYPSLTAPPPVPQIISVTSPLGPTHSPFSQPILHAFPHFPDSPWLYKCVSMRVLSPLAGSVPSSFSPPSPALAALYLATMSGDFSLCVFSPSNHSPIPFLPCWNKEPPKHLAVSGILAYGKLTVKRGLGCGIWLRIKNLTAYKT